MDVSLRDLVQSALSQFSVTMATPCKCQEWLKKTKRYTSHEVQKAIADRFDQLEYRTYSSLQALILKATRKEDFSEELKTVCTLYGSDLHAANSQSQLKILSSIFSSSSGDIVEVKNYIQKVTASERILMKEVVLLMKLTLQQRMPPVNEPLVQCARSSCTFNLQRLKGDLEMYLVEQSFIRLFTSIALSTHLLKHILFD